MVSNSNYESRAGKLSCTAEIFYKFITDIRNLEQFIPEGSLTSWKASSDDCSFYIPPLGNASVEITSRNANTLVEYSGEAFKMNKFRLVADISENDKNLAEIRLILSADLNPVLKMMVSKPIDKFLELLVSEMEKYDKWNKHVNET
jgi:hypothetical protein